MPGPPPIPAARRDRRLEEIVRAAASVFATWGLSRTQVQDIARQAEVAAGTVYLYASSKHALFDLAYRGGLLGHWDFLSEITTPHEATRESTLRWAAELADWRTLCPVTADSMQAGADVATVVESMWDELHRLRLAVRLSERSVREWADLAGLFLAGVRAPLISAIAVWLDGRRAAGEGTFEGDPAVAAWDLLDFTSLSAVHRHFDAGRGRIDVAACRSMTIHVVSRGFAPC